MSGPNTGFPKGIITLAYIYLALPFLIFVTGYLRWYYAIPSAAVVVISVCLSLAGYKASRFDLPTSNNVKILFIIILILFFWIFLSGIGGYGYQVGDHNARNAVFRDLIDYKWPVVYDSGAGPVAGQLHNSANGMLVYYFGYWLPAALVGKWLGWKAANFALFLWTLAGVSLIYYLICLYLKRISVKFLLILIFWGGASIVGILLNFSVHDFIHSEYNLYAGPMVYGYNTGGIYWIFNQVVMIWLVILLLFNGMIK